ncbi:pyrroline-5-carboxylate reductase [Algimonas arctica]|uniref:Pyrroline-5-carboxylate reductase n=1 Tax=Algimonas arctica TaxID=1479486 RepID=A0A8J3CPB4_9PROT|nr:pyrroline-5-carboxylate reductase [Algimonas arctica]GHA91022.1 pyrroline-5-carboxylate reductase [Algimonas arctica]
MAQTYLIVGAGNMGGALLSGWLKSSLVNARNLAIIDPNPGIEAVYAIERGAKHLADFDGIPRNTKTILLAVKPQMFPQMRRQLAEALGEDVLIISIMAGISTQALKDAFPGADIVRAMPNTPAAIGKGVTAFTADPALKSEKVEAIKTLLGATGKVIRIETDEQINAVTAVSGSGPAYIFNLCEALAKAAQSIGLPPDVAAQLARETIIGASALLEASDQSPTELREAVTSPGGTTQAALDVLMADDGQGQLMRRAVVAALARAREFSE